MAKLTLTDLANLQNESTAVSAINANNTAIETALENTLSRDGTSPNTMTSQLDMNSNRIINLAAPVSNADAVRKIDLDTLEASISLAALNTAVTNAETAETGAAASATAAASSATAAATSATEADASATIASSVATVYETRTSVESATVPASADALVTRGYSSAGDGGGALYKRVVSEPTHDGKITSADGAFWELAEVEPNEAMFGGVVGATNAVHTAAIQSLFTYTGFAVSGVPFRKCRVVNEATITSSLSVPSFVTVEFHARLNKGFNGDMFSSLGSVVKLIRLRLDGKGATFTGRGIVIASGVEQVLEDPKITDMESYCLDFTTGEQGTTFRCNGGLLQSLTGYAVRMPATEATTNGFRWFTNVNTGGTPFIEMRNGNYTILNHCVFTELDYTGTTTGRSVVMGCRIATTSGITLYGTEHQFSFNTIGNQLTLGSGCTRCSVISNLLADSRQVIDDSGNATNSIDTEFDFTPVWEGSSTNPTIGNGTLTGRLVRRGKSVTVHIRLSVGSTTTLGTGTWSFKLPASMQATYAVGDEAVGGAYAFDSGTGWRAGVCHSVVGTLTLVGNETSGTLYGSGSPIGWATGDRLNLSITYNMG